MGKAFHQEYLFSEKKIPVLSKKVARTFLLNTPDECKRAARIYGESGGTRKSLIEALNAISDRAIRAGIEEVRENARNGWDAYIKDKNKDMNRGAEDYTSR